MFGRKAHVLSRMVLVLDTRDWNYYFRIDNPLNITQCTTRGLITQHRNTSVSNRDFQFKQSIKTTHYKTD